MRGTRHLSVNLPINGLRHKAENGTCGWYIWCGE
ncbi:immunity protein Imm33 domain-containing protein [Shewanella sp. OMA3-2]